MIGTHDLSHVLGVEPGRERGRTHKVTEHDRELAAFSRSCNLRRLQGGSIRSWPACCINASCRQFVTAFQAEFGARRVRVAARRTASEKSRTALQAELAAFGNIGLAARTLHGSSPDLTRGVYHFSIESEPLVRNRDQLRWTTASPQSGIIDRFGKSRPSLRSCVFCQSGVQSNKSISGPGAAFRRPLATEQRPFVRERNGHRSFIDRPVEVGEQPMIATPDGRARPRHVAATDLSGASPSGKRSRSAAAPLSQPAPWQGA
jgi:hypothetical protein